MGREGIRHPEGGVFLRLGFIVLPLALLSAGCVGVGAPLEPSAAAPPAASPLDLLVNAHECDEAGAITLNPTLGFNDGIVPAPFYPADTTPYAGIPLEAGMVGVYHAAYECHMWDVNGDVANHPGGGWVGILVEDPGFEGVEPVDLNILVATFATRDLEIHRVLSEAGLYVYNAMAHVNGDEIAGTWTVQAILNTEGDGIYESDLVMQPGDPIPLFRLWVILDGPDGRLHPAYFDIAQEGGTRWIGQGYFQHTLNADHPGGVANGHVGGLGFTGVQRTITFTVLPDVMEERWDH